MSDSLHLTLPSVSRKAFAPSWSNVYSIHCIMCIYALVPVSLVFVSDVLWHNGIDM